MDLARYNWRSVLFIATFAMLFQNAFSYVCQVVMPILADRMATEFEISRAWLGFYLFIQNLVAVLAALGCGSFILRLGALRVSQLSLVLMALSLFFIASGQLWLFPIAAILLGASSVSTPASSHILHKVCPERLAPLIFSIKQTGVPVGSLIGGLLIPFFLGLSFYVAATDKTYELGPFGTAFALAIIVLLVAALLQPIRSYFDADRQRNARISFGDIRTTLNMVLSNYALRDIAFAAFAFGGLQSLFAGFFVLYLIDGLGYSEVGAGSIYAIASFSAVVARIIWGGIGSKWLSSRMILGGIGLIGGIAAILVTGFDENTSSLEITLIAILYNITGLSWHGVLLAETAKLAPEGMVGPVTGGVLSGTSASMLVYPAIYGVILALTGSYEIGFIVAALPAFAAFLIFIRPPIQRGWFS